MTPLRRTVIPLAMFLFASVIAQAGVLADHPGYWLGDLKVADGSVLKMGVESFTRADGSRPLRARLGAPRPERAGARRSFGLRSDTNTLVQQRVLDRR